MSTILHIGAAPEILRAEALYCDGASPMERPASIEIDEAASALRIALPAGGASWPLASLRALPDQAERRALVLSGPDPLARLLLRDPEAIRVLRARCPELTRARRPGGWLKLAGWATAAIASVATIIFLLVPVMADQLARYLPPAGEKAFGDATFEQMRAALAMGDAPLTLCEAPGGVRALEQMTSALSAGLGLPFPAQASVLDSDMLNAFALPGGRIVLFRGLLEAADHPDEIAAVMAHELGHVAARDPVRMALRTAGSAGVLGLLLGDFAGGTIVLFAAERLIEARYSREAELAADRYALDVLGRLGIPAGAMASMYERFRAEYGDGDPLLEPFASHPRLSQRIASAREAEIPAEGPVVLEPREWAALQAICR